MGARPRAHAPNTYVQHARGGEGTTPDVPRVSSGSAAALASCAPVRPLSPKGPARTGREPSKVGTGRAARARERRTTCTLPSEKRRPVLLSPGQNLKRPEPCSCKYLFHVGEFSNHEKGQGDPSRCAGPLSSSVDSFDEMPASSNATTSLGQACTRMHCIHHACSLAPVSLGPLGRPGSMRERRKKKEARPWHPGPGCHGFWGLQVANDPPVSDALTSTISLICPVSGAKHDVSCKRVSLLFCCCLLSPESLLLRPHNRTMSALQRVRACREVR